MTLYEHGEKTLGSLLLLPMLLRWECGNGRGKPLPYGKVLVLCGSYMVYRSFGLERKL